MPLLSARNLTKSHGIKTLFSDVTFGIDERERVAVIGVNGSGKSTLLKILAGAEQADSGEIVFRTGARVEFASQNASFDPNHSILDHVLHSHAELAEAFSQHAAACEAVAAESPGASALLASAQSRLDALHAWEFDARAKAILGKLGIQDVQASVAGLSGGFRKRVSLARALLADWDLLILDEPTNHLDADMVAWLEDYLLKSSGAVLLVTHDRYFLDRVTDRLIEIDQGKVRFFEGGFSDYLEAREAIDQAHARHDERRRSILRKELEWLSRGARARRTKEKHRVERVQQMLSDRPARGADPLQFQSGTRRLGGKIVEMEHVSITRGDRLILRKFSYTFQPGERLGVIGPNGAGKTTLVQLMSGDLAPDSGRIERGSTVVMARFHQEFTDFDETESVLDYIKRVSGDAVRSAGGAVMTAERMLETFHFTPQMQRQAITRLSGGERRRLHLVSTLLADPNFLVLDEPTNDLDIPTLQSLEDYLDGFRGCLLVVSHDRYFLDRTVDHLLALDGEGQARLYPGDYSLYQRMRDEESRAEKSLEGSGEARGTSRAATPESGGEASPAPKKKLSYKEQRELEALDRDIPVWEQSLVETEQAMIEAATDYEKLGELTARQADLREKIEAGTERWLELSEYR